MIGGNVSDVLDILGVTAWVRPIPVPAATAVLLVFARTGRRRDRAESALFLVAQGADVAVLAATARGASR